MLRRCDGDELRVIAIAPTFESLLGSAFDEIRRNAGGNVSVMSQMLGALETIASRTESPRRRLALREQVQRIVELADRTIDSAHDRAQLEARLTGIRKSLETEPAASEGRDFPSADRWENDGGALA